MELQGKQSFTGKYNVFGTLGSLMTCWMMLEAGTLTVAASDITERGKKAAEVRRCTSILQFWLSKLAK